MKPVYYTCTCTYIVYTTVVQCVCVFVIRVHCLRFSINRVVFHLHKVVLLDACDGHGVVAHGNGVALHLHETLGAVDVAATGEGGGATVSTCPLYTHAHQCILLLTV